MDIRSPMGRRRLFWIGIGALALITLILRTLALTLCLDIEIGYFASGAALPFVARILTVVSLLACFAPFFLLKAQELPEERKPLGLAGRIAAGIAAVCFLVTAVYLLTHLTTLPAPTVLVLLAAVFSVLAALFFVLLLRGQDGSAAACGYGVILAAVLMLSITYFDRYTQMNAPHKVSLHLAMLSIMLCMLFEIRPMIGRSKPRGLAVTSSICFFCTAVFGGSNLIAFMAGIYTDPLYLMGDLAALGFAVYLACRTVVDLLPAATTDPVETEEKQ